MTACSMPLPASPADVPLHSERLGCWNHTEQELVLLAGWSMDSRIWRSLLPRLRQIAHITLIELPGMGRSAPGSYDLPGLLTAIEQQDQDLDARLAAVEVDLHPFEDRGLTVGPRSMSSGARARTSPR